MAEETTETQVENQETEQTEGQTEQTEQQTAETKEEGAAQERIQQLTKDVEAQKESNVLLQQNLALLKANTPPPQQVEQFDIFKHVGLDPEDPEDMPNQKQLKDILSHHNGAIRSQINQLMFMTEHPDYSEVVGTAEQLRLGQFGEPLKEALKANPALIATIQASPQPQAAAYSIAKLHQQNKVKGQETTKTDAEQVIESAVKNANKVKSASNTKGGTALTGENRYEGMTDAEFVKLAIANGASF